MPMLLKHEHSIATCRLVLHFYMVGASSINSYFCHKQLLKYRNHSLLRHQIRVFLEHVLGSLWEYSFFVHLLLSWHQPTSLKVKPARIITDNDVTLKGLPEKL